VSWDELEHASRLLALHLSEAVLRLGSGALDVIDLPPLTGASIEPAQLRSVAALFWAMEVDGAGLLDFVDALAEGSRLGRFNVDLGRAAARLFDWHRRRGERLSGDERHALYGRVFGAADFGRRFDELVGELARVAEDGGARPEVLARVQVAAAELAIDLSARSAGITAFAAREIVDAIREALTVLHEPALLAAFGRRTAVDLLAATGAVVLDRELDPASSFDRARAGQTILSWLADIAPRLEAGSVALTPADPVVQAASAWQAAQAVRTPHPGTRAIEPRPRQAWT
jgi:hypothetical protein